MRTLLIWPPGMRTESWTMFPLGLGYLDNVGEITLLDLSLENLDRSVWAGRVAGFDVIGVSVWGFNLPRARNLVAFLRQLGDATIITGGPSARLAQGDYAVVGEGEATLGALLGCLREGDTAGAAAIPGVAVGDTAPENPPRFQEDLDAFGPVNYSKLHLDRYLATGYKDWMYSLKDKFRSAPVMATRGCPYHCSYCSGPVLMGRRVRKHSVSYVIETIERLYTTHDVRQISFLDDNLTFDTDYAKRLCEAMIGLQETRGFTFVLTSLNGVRVGRLDEELLALMKRAGWAEIVIAPESGSPQTLKRMGKTIDLGDVGRKIDMIHKHRMNAVGYFLLGYPGDTRKDLDLTRDYILGSGFDRCVLNFFNPIPGTPIHAELVEAGVLGDGPAAIDYKAVGFIPEDLNRDDLLATRDAVREKTVFREKWIKDL